MMVDYVLCPSVSFHSSTLC